jgi:CheY-like chemotaxis protein
MMVIPAENGAAAIRRAVATRPNVILMDLDMPVMGGLEAIERLKKDPRTASIPIAVLSGNAHRDYASVAQAGCSVCLAKPCSPEDLEGVVLSLLEPRGARGATSASR